MDDYSKYDPYGTYDVKGEDPYSILMRMSSWNKELRSTISDVQETLEGTIERQSQIIQDVSSITLNVTNIATMLDESVVRIGSLEVTAENITAQVSAIDVKYGAGLAAASGRIDVLAGKVDLKAESSVVTDLGGRVRTAELSIDGLNGSISSKVSFSDFNGHNIVSIINQTAASVSISAQAIDLYGITNVANYLTLGTGYGSDTGLYFKGAAVSITSHGDTMNLNAPYIRLNGDVDLGMYLPRMALSHQSGTSFEVTSTGMTVRTPSGTTHTFRSV